MKISTIYENFKNLLVSKFNLDINSLTYLFILIAFILTSILEIMLCYVYEFRRHTTTRYKI